MARVKRVVSQLSEQELDKMTRSELIKDLDEREIAFCENFVQSHNIRIAAVKAGYNVGTNLTMYSYKLMNNEGIKNYIAWLNVKMYRKAMINAEQIIEFYGKMAFYDVTDFVDITPSGKLKIKSFDLIDGQLIQEINQNSQGGYSIKFPDRLRALEKLENFMNPSPYDWKRNVEERKLKLLETEMEIKKSKLGIGQEIEDDNFLEALKNVSSNVFKNEKLDEEDDEND